MGLKNTESYRYNLNIYKTLYYILKLRNLRELKLILVKLLSKDPVT